MRKQMGWRLPAIAVIGVAGVGAVAAEFRTWSDSSGKFSVEAELLSAKDGKVQLRSTEGKEMTLPLARLSEADQAYVKEHSAKTSAPKESKPAPPAAASKLIREIAERFYKDLRTKERTEAQGALTDPAQALAKEGKSPLASLPTPDKAATAIKAGKPKIDGAAAEVPVQVRVGGGVQQTTLHLRSESDEWRVFAISAKFGQDEKTINFEASVAPAGETQDPLAALVGQSVEITGLTLDGKPLSLADYKGKVVLIDFWATWCGPCRAEIPNILANWQKYHETGFDVVAISVDQDLEALRKFVAEEQPPWKVVADNHPQNRSPMGNKFQISGIPAFVLVGKDGKVAAVHCRGERLGQQLAQLLGK